MANTPTYKQQEWRVKELEGKNFELQQVAKGLHESHDYLEKLFYYANAPIIVWDPESVITRFNRAFEHLTGLRANEVIGQKLYILFPETTRDESLNKIADTLRGEYWKSVEIPILRKDGDIRVVLWNSANIYAEDGKTLSATIAQGVDITKRKRAEKALRESEERYRLLADNVTDVIWIRDMDLTMTYISPSITKMTGYSIEEAMAFSFDDAYTPASIEVARSALAEELAIEKTGNADPLRVRTLELEGFCKDHSRIWTEAKMSFLRDKTGRPVGIFGISRDITERKQVERSLRESEERYRSILEAAPDSITISRVKDGCYLQVNDAFCKMRGYSREEALGRTSLDLNIFTDPGDRERVIKILKENGEVNGFEIRYQRKDGRVIDTLLSARPIEYKNEDCMIAVVTDVTELKAAQNALRESEEKYRLLVETANDAIFIVQDQKIKFPNPTAIEMARHLGFDVERTPFLSHIHPEDRKMVIERHKKRVKGKKVPNTYTFRIIGSDGEVLWVELNAVLITWEGKRATLNFLRDITQQKKLEIQLQEARRMEALGTLARGIAHDFNNLLMGIQGRTSLMLMDTDFGHPYYEDLKGIEDIVRSAADMTKQLLGFARSGKYEVKPTDMNEVIQKSAQMFGRTKREIKIHTKYQENIWSVEADPSQIEQVLLNLYINAWQAMPGGGDLYLQTDNLTLDESHSKPYRLNPGKYVKISITDTGVGMDEAIRERIFDPFFTTKAMGRGMGLGLASVYGIIKNHDGIINVFSQRGEGTTFDIYLPASAKKVISGKTLQKKALKGTGTVLLVDDEDIIVSIWEKNLKTMGYDVITAKNGKEAIERYKENLARVDIVLLDMIMPEMGGGKTYDRLKEINPNVKVLLSSGYSIEGQASEILKRGCNGFIQKPFRMRLLLKKMKEILEKA